MIIDREKLALLASIDDGVIMAEPSPHCYEVYFPSVLGAACFHLNMTNLPSSERPYAAHVRLLGPVHDLAQAVMVRVLIDERYR